MEGQEETRKPTVMLVGSWPVGAAGLRDILSQESSVDLVPGVRSGADAVAAATTIAPDYIVVAAAGLTVGEMELLKSIHQASPNCMLVVCSRLDDDALRKVGTIPAQGHLIWSDVSAEPVHATLETVAAGLYVASPEAVEAVRAPSSHASEISALTERQRWVLEGLEDDLTNSEIAERVRVGIREVQRVIRAIKDKLQVRNLYTVGKKMAKLRPD